MTAICDIIIRDIVMKTERPGKKVNNDMIIDKLLQVLHQHFSFRSVELFRKERPLILVDILDLDWEICFVWHIAAKWTRREISPVRLGSDILF